jgi:hypothetical protein
MMAAQQRPYQPFPQQQPQMAAQMHQQPIHPQFQQASHHEIPQKRPLQERIQNLMPPIISLELLSKLDTMSVSSIFI